MGAFAARARPREPRAREPERELRPIDLVALGLATFKAARTLSHDEVTSFLRQPFVVEEAHEGEDETPAGKRYAAGDRRARHVHALHRHLDRSRARVVACR